MLLFLTAIDKHQVKRQFSCQFPDLETGFEFLNQIVAKGHKLIRADLVDEKQTTSLPLEAFDGVSFLPALNQFKVRMDCYFSGTSSIKHRSRFTGNSLVSRTASLLRTAYHSIRVNDHRHEQVFINGPKLPSNHVVKQVIIPTTLSWYAMKLNSNKLICFAKNA